MAVSSDEALGGIAATETIEHVQNDPFTVDEINSLSDLIQTGKTKGRPSPMTVNEETIEFCRELILNLDEWVEDMLDVMEDMELEEMVETFEENKSELKDQYETVENSLTRVNDSVIEDLNSPSTYYSLRKFFDISKIFFERTVSLDEESLKEIDEDIFKEKMREESFFIRLGILVSLQPYLVKAALIADKRNDTEFLSKYEEVVDEHIRGIINRDKDLYKEYME